MKETICFAKNSSLNVLPCHIPHWQRSAATTSSSIGTSHSLSKRQIWRCDVCTCPTGWGLWCFFPPPPHETGFFFTVVRKKMNTATSWVSHKWVCFYMWRASWSGPYRAAFPGQPAYLPDGLRRGLKIWMTAGCCGCLHRHTSRSVQAAVHTFVMTGRYSTWEERKNKKGGICFRKHKRQISNFKVTS